MMGIIQEILDELLSPQCILSETMRKAYIPATKLEFTKLKEWLDLETQGYPNDMDQIPIYRCLHGQCKGLTPFYTLENINFDSHIAEEALSRIKYKNSIFEIEKLLQNPNTVEFTLVLPYNLIRMYNIINCHQLVVFIERRKLQNIINSAKNVLIAFIAKLDNIGIEGNNYNFTSDEKVKTMVINQTFNVSGGNFINQIATENSSQIQNNDFDIEKVKELYKIILNNKNELNLNSIQLTEIDKELSSLKKEMDKEKPSPSILQKSLMSIKNIIEGAASSVIGQMIINSLHL